MMHINCVHQRVQQTHIHMCHYIAIFARSFFFCCLLFFCIRCKFAIYSALVFFFGYSLMANGLVVMPIFYFRDRFIFVAHWPDEGARVKVKWHREQMHFMLCCLCADFTWPSSWCFLEWTFFFLVLCGISMAAGALLVLFFFFLLLWTRGGFASVRFQYFFLSLFILCHHTNYCFFKKIFIFISLHNECNHLLGAFSVPRYGWTFMMLVS